MKRLLLVPLFLWSGLYGDIRDLIRLSRERRVDLQEKHPELRLAKNSTYFPALKNKLPEAKTPIQRTPTKKSQLPKLSYRQYLLKLRFACDTNKDEEIKEFFEKYGFRVHENDLGNYVRSFSTLKLFVRYGLNIHDGKYNLLSHSLFPGYNRRMFRWLIVQGVKPPKIKQSGEAPLAIAAQLRNYEAAEALMAMGAAPYQRSYGTACRRSPIEVAEGYNDERMLKILKAKYIQGSELCTFLGED